MYPQTQSPVSAHSKEQGESLTQMNTPAFAKLNLFLLVTGRTMVIIPCNHCSP
jgi:hypothetical protein